MFGELVLDEKESAGACESIMLLAVWNCGKAGDEYVWFRYLALEPPFESKLVSESKLELVLVPGLLSVDGTMLFS